VLVIDVWCYNGGPWHFDRALLVIQEPRGLGDVRLMSFDKATFWVQIHNAPMLCMTTGDSSVFGRHDWGGERGG
jgi:hypothetical protein